MRNSIAVAIGLRFRFNDFDPGTILKCADKTYMKMDMPKYPLVDLETGQVVHWEAVQKMEFGLFTVGSRITFTIAQKPKLRARNKYVRVKRQES